MRIVLHGVDRRVQLSADELAGIPTFTVYSLPVDAPNWRYARGRLEYRGPSATEAVAIAERVAGVPLPRRPLALNRALYREAQRRRAA